jgi:hypothetical protein
VMGPDHSAAPLAETPAAGDRSLGVLINDVWEEPAAKHKAGRHHARETACHCGIVNHYTRRSLASAVQSTGIVHFVLTNRWTRPSGLLTCLIFMIMETFSYIEHQSLHDHGNQAVAA